jgi:hypothetical protein
MSGMFYAPYAVCLTGGWWKSGLKYFLALMDGLTLVRMGAHAVAISNHWIMKEGG